MTNSHTSRFSSYSNLAQSMIILRTIHVVGHSIAHNLNTIFIIPGIIWFSFLPVLVSSSHSTQPLELSFFIYIVESNPRIFFVQADQRGDCLGGGGQVCDFEPCSLRGGGRVGGWLEGLGGEASFFFLVGLNTTSSYGGSRSTESVSFEVFDCIDVLSLTLLPA